jgi:hypothetical protein
MAVCHTIHIGKEMITMVEEKIKKDPKFLLEEAIKKRDDLNIFIKVLEEMIGTSSDSSQGVSGASKGSEVIPAGEISDPLSVIYPGMFFGKSQPQAVKLLLERVRRPLKMKRILECLEKGGLKIGGKKPGTNLWGTLNKNTDIFILVPKAGWALTDWYDASVVTKYRKESEGKEGENGKEEESEK